jgi:hypothetical protein
MAGNVANHGYLPGVVLKELDAGRICEITGSVVTTIKNMDDYNKNRDRLIGKFGEVINRKEKSLIATRDPPMWAKEKIHSVIWECEEMIRWEAPEDVR